MRVTFYAEMTEHLGLEYLSAVLLQRGHDTRLVFNPKLFDNHGLTFPRLERWIGRDVDTVVAAIERSCPDVVAFSANLVTYRGVREVAAAVRRRLQVPVVVGGPMATSMPAELLATGLFDYLVAGEGEEALAELIEALSSGRDPSVLANVGCVRAGRPVVNPSRPLVEEIDTLPFPDRDLFARERALSGLITASRGCPFACAFCAAGTVLGRSVPNPRKWYRQRGAAAVVREAADAAARHGLRRFHFCDDVFPRDARWVREFSEAWRADVGAPFDINTAPLRMTREVIEALKQAGCEQVSIGVQSASRRLLKDVMHRAFDLDVAAELVRGLSDAGIRTVVDVMFGTPGEGADQMLETAQWVLARLPPSAVPHGFVYGPLPGTPLERAAIDQGALDPAWRSRLGTEKQDHYGRTQVQSADPWLPGNVGTLLSLLAALPRAFHPLIRLSRARSATPVLRFLAPAARLLVDPALGKTYLATYARTLPTLVRERVGRLARP